MVIKLNFIENIGFFILSFIIDDQKIKNNNLILYKYNLPSIIIFRLF